jgi:geranylgeranyl diphosphate synthase type II
VAFELQPYLDARREQVEARLRDLLRCLEGSPPALREAVEYGLLAPGKRLRPLLTILAAEACGGAIPRALSAGCAVEMIHAYSLIHDDLPAMDDDDLRRGRPTVHKKYGEALAILAGDTLLTLAFQVIVTEYLPAVAAACIYELATHSGALGMIGGQVDDLTWDGKISGSKVSESLAGLESIHTRKTGALFRASLALGQLTAEGAEPDAGRRDCLDRFAYCFGLAFQITDDLLDVEGNAQKAGKRVGKDAKRGKLTYPGLSGIENSRQQARELCRQAAEAVESLGAPAGPLVALVRTLCTRDR